MIEIPVSQAPCVGAMMMLHGWGADAQDLAPLAEMFGFGNLRYILPEGQVQVPGTGGKGKGWFSFPVTENSEGELAESRRQITDLIRKTVRGTPPVKNIFLMGFSQGAALALDGVLSCSDQPDIFSAIKGIIFLSGFVLNEAGSSQKTVAKVIPLFAGHGLYDPLIPLDKTKSALFALGKRGFLLDWHEYPMGHQIIKEEFEDIKKYLKKNLPSLSGITGGISPR